MTKRRVVLITEIIAPYRIPVFNLLSRQAGIDLRVIFLAETDPSLRKWAIYKDEIQFSYEVLPSWRWWGGKRGLLINRGLRAALGKANPEAIICGGYNYPASWQALRWSRNNNVRFVLWSESNREDQRGKSRIVDWLKRKFVRSCDGFVVPGKSASTYLSDLGVRAEDIFVAPNAVDNEFFCQRAAQARDGEPLSRESRNLPKRFILCPVRLVREKGVFDLLEAYANLNEKVRAEVAVVFAGDGPERRQLAEQAGSIRPGSVYFPGFVQREELAILYALAEIMVLPTHSDPWGLVVNEAMASGLPIIVTNVAGCSADLVEDGWNGYVVPPSDAKALAGKLEILLQSPEIRKQMSARSLDRIGNYSPEACAAGLAASAIAGKGSR